MSAPHLERVLELLTAANNRALLLDHLIEDHGEGGECARCDAERHLIAAAQARLWGNAE
jgi:hypothetical protein